jgi:hypothetical protein
MAGTKAAAVARATVLEIDLATFLAIVRSLAERDMASPPDVVPFIL